MNTATREEIAVERWLSIAGLEGLYSVSNFGRVRSEQKTLERKSGQHTRKAQIMSPAASRAGYLSVAIGIGSNRRTCYVHTLVLEAFVSLRPTSMDACHEDGNPRNNNLKNLRWDTRAGNHADKSRHGTDTIGERHPASKLTDETVLAIRNMRAAGCSVTQMAERYGVSRMTASRAASGRSWSHIK